MSDSKITAFKTAVKNHDLTYMYSDDGAVVRRGSESMAAIRLLAAELPIEIVREIWNSRVDQSLAEGFRETFYWK
jgi:hypothetical protein